MPQLINTVLTDRAATPVAHTYIPLEIRDGVAVVVENNGVPIGWNSVSASLRKTPSGGYKATMKGKFPILQTQVINGVSTPVVVRTAYADLVFSFDATSSEQERKDVLGLITSAIAPGNTLYNDFFTKLQAIY